MELRPYQHDGVAWLRESFGDPHARVRLLADEMGLGKTVQAVAAFPGPLWSDPDPAILVVAPAGVHRSWQRHVAEWRPDLACSLVGATADLRPPRLGEVLVVSPDALGWASGESKRRGRGRPPAKGATPADDEAAAKEAKRRAAVERTRQRSEQAFARLRSSLLALGPRALIAVDEAHRVKGATATRARAVGALCGPAAERGATVWGITATPAPRDALDLWCLMERLGGSRHPAAWGGRGIVGWQEWSRGTCKRGGQWSFAGEPRSSVADALPGLFLRRLVAEHAEEIPPPTHAIHVVRLSDDLAAEADGILADACRSLGVDPRRAHRDASEAGDDLDDALTATMAHLDRGKMSALGAKLSAAKVPTVMALMREHIDAGRAVIVYSENRAPIDAVAAAGFPVIVGGMTAKSIAAAVESFQDGEAPVIGFTAAGREGVTLTRASVFIEADTGWSADDRNQALGRAVRIGQEESVSVIHVVAAHPLEALKMRVLRRKRRFGLTALGSSM